MQPCVAVQNAMPNLDFYRLGYQTLKGLIVLLKKAACS